VAPEQPKNEREDEPGLAVAARREQHDPALGGEVPGPQLVVQRDLERPAGRIDEPAHEVHE
jgi:hypothetical protein